MEGVAVGRDIGLYNKRLGAALRQIRHDAGYTAEAAAERIEVSAESLARWERGDNAIRAYHLAALAELYGLSAPGYAMLVDPPELVSPWRALLEGGGLAWAEETQRNTTRRAPASNEREWR